MIEVSTVTEHQERYVYHGKDELDRLTINHGQDQRKVIDFEENEWPAYSPEECIDYSGRGQWYKALDTDKEYLLCLGCGLDCT